MKTSHPQAAAVAQYMGVRFCPTSAARTEYSVDCTPADFDEALAEMAADGWAPNPKVDAIMSEGFGRKAY